MANETKGPIWILDTPGAVSARQLRIERISWKNATTLNHTCKVVDMYGKTVFEDFASGSTYNNPGEPIGRAVDGLTVETLDSGKLYVVLSQRPTTF